MNHLEVKKQIDAHIQTERWMTPQLATKMAVAKRKKQRSIKPLVIIVCAALLCIVFVASFKESSPSHTAPPTEAIEQIMANPLLTSMFNDYLAAIEQQDELTLATLSFDYFKGENLKKLYKLYENINFNSIEIVNIVPSKGEPAFSIFITTENEETNEILIHSIEMVQSNEDFYVSENLDATWHVYTPYEPPQTLALTYGVAPVGIEDNSWAIHDVELAQPSIEMPNVGLVHFYKQGDGLVLVVVEREQHYIQLGYLDDLGEVFTMSQFALEPLYVIETSAMQRRLLMYVQQDQIYWFEMDSNNSLTVSDLNDDGEIELLFNDTIVRIFNDELQYAFIHDVIEEQWQQLFITIEFKENKVHLQYEDFKGKIVAEYAFDEEMQLQLQTKGKEK